MKTKLAIITLVTALLAPPLLAADSQSPVELNAEENKMVDGIAVATGNAKLTFRGVTVTADKIEYNSDKRNARLFVLDPKKTFFLLAVIDLEPRQ